MGSGRDFLDDNEKIDLEPDVRRLVRQLEELTKQVAELTKEIKELKQPKKIQDMGPM